MKIRCDVCDKEEASVFCSADEAALCVVCDYHVHHANKLATNHLRFSIIHPSYPESPHCDICQERRAFLFCKEDRAILCRECDISIHSANEIMQKHSRFILTGVKLSASSSAYSAPPCSSGCNVKTNKLSAKRSKTSSKEFTSSPSDQKPIQSMSTSYMDTVSISSISKYLMETPGWCVDDFLDPSSSSYGYSEVCSTPFI